MRHSLCILVALFAVACHRTETPHATRPHPAHWDYGTGEGPSHWGDLSPEFAACARGAHQSPVVLASSSTRVDDGLTLAAAPIDGIATDTGHALQVDVDAGETLTVDGRAFTLRQFHFHVPSEHTIDGVRAAAELHLVHRAADGHLAVLGVLLQPGAENPLLAAALSAPPRDEHRVVHVGPLDLRAALPADMRHFAYDGSLTAPPCTEGVHWMVLRTLGTASPAQLDALRARHPGNARPLQTPTGLVVTQSPAS